jgi:hypothetical protein
MDSSPYSHFLGQRCLACANPLSMRNLPLASDFDPVEMLLSGANPIDFPINPSLKVGRSPGGDWNYTHLSLLMQRCFRSASLFGTLIFIQIRANRSWSVSAKVNSALDHSWYAVPMGYVE